LDIAKYLYRVTENNKKFKKWIYETIPEPKRGQGIIKTDENYPEYYGLLEIACRLYDLLK
jgi:hypothetical protein